MITEDYVSFETAKLLKEKGFDEECHRFWQYDKANNKDDTDGISLSECNVYLPLSNSKIDYLFKDKLMSYGYSAPTLQLAMKWLREKYNQHITIQAVNNVALLKIEYYVEIQNLNEPTEKRFCVNGCHRTRSYEEACEYAIKYCLENLI